jgi:hypothetical protein
MFSRNFIRAAKVSLPSGLLSAIGAPFLKVDSIIYYYLIIFKDLPPAARGAFLKNRPPGPPEKLLSKVPGYNKILYISEESATMFDYTTYNISHI